MLLTDLTEGEFKLLDFFEDEEYELTEVQVTVDVERTQTVLAWTFPGRGHAVGLLESEIWDYELDFLVKSEKSGGELGTRPEYIEMCREVRREWDGK